MHKKKWDLIFLQTLEIHKLLYVYLSYPTINYAALKIFKQVCQKGGEGGLIDTILKKIFFILWKYCPLTLLSFSFKIQDITHP